MKRENTKKSTQLGLIRKREKKKRKQPIIYVKKEKKTAPYSDNSTRPLIPNQNKQKRDRTTTFSLVKTKRVSIWSTTKKKRSDDACTQIQGIVGAMCMRSFLCVCVCMSVCDTQFPYGQRQEQKTQRKKKTEKKITNKEIKNNELTLAWVIEKKKRQKLKKKGSSAHNLPSTSYTRKKRTHLPHGKNDREEWGGKSTRSKDYEVSRTNESANKEKQSQYSFFFLLPTLELQRNSTSRIQQQ